MLKIELSLNGSLATVHRVAVPPGGAFEATFLLRHDGSAPEATPADGADGAALTAAAVAPAAEPPCAPAAELSVAFVPMAPSIVDAAAAGYTTPRARARA